MERPLLTTSSPAQQHRHPGVFRRICSAVWQAIWDRGDCSFAETIELLNKTLADLDMLMPTALEKERAKKEQSARVLRTTGNRKLALQTFATARVHRRRYEAWHGMREMVEQIKSELMYQQQTAAVFQAFSVANEAMGKLAERLNVDTLETVLDSLRDRMESGQEVSGLLSDPSQLDDGTWDEDEAARQFEDFLRGGNEDDDASGQNRGAKIEPKTENSQKVQRVSRTFLEKNTPAEASLPVSHQHHHSLNASLN